MRRNGIGRIGFVLIITAIAASVTVGAPSAAPAPDTGGTQLSVGEFLVLYAHSIHLNIPPNASAEMALQLLRSAGVQLPTDLDLRQPLTHGSLVRIGEMRGVRLTTTTPGRTLDRGEAEMFLRAFVVDSFSRTLAPAPTPGGSQQTTAAATGGRSSNPPGDPAGHAGDKGKGKKKGRPFASPSTPGDGDTE